MAPDVAEVLLFEVNGQRLGLPAEQVRELHAAMAIAPLASDAPGVSGVVNLRGNLVPVIDVRRVLGMPVKEIALTDHLIVVHVEERLFALHVDRALELRQISTTALCPLPGATLRAVQLDDGLVLVHPLSELLRGITPRSAREAS